MPQPRFASIVHWIAVIACAIGVIFGALMVFSAFDAIRTNKAMFVLALTSGVLTILGSLGGLGLVNCFLSLVRAQIDTRNAVVAQGNH